LHRGQPSGRVCALQDPALSELEVVHALLRQREELRHDGFTQLHLFRDSRLEGGNLRLGGKPVGQKLLALDALLFHDFNF